MPNWGILREQRRGIMLHYDASASDAGAVAWLLHDPRCRVSYNWLILDDGQVVQVAPPDARAWHAGVCRPSGDMRLTYRDANSAFYGIAIAAADGDKVTPPQWWALIGLCRKLFEQHGWGKDEVWRIVGHDTECWPRGRKVDPTGTDPRRPVLRVVDVREAL